MSSKSEKDKQKQIQDKCQALLNAMLRDEDNKYCVDCDSKGEMKMVKFDVKSSGKLSIVRVDRKVEQHY